MPIYQYELVDGECKICGGAFELMRPVDRSALDSCPLCKKAVRKCITNISTPKILKPLSLIDAKKAGFSVFKKRDKGTYEKL